jgi:hypothetical protein
MADLEDFPVCHLPSVIKQKVWSGHIDFATTLLFLTFVVLL